MNSFNDEVCEYTPTPVTENFVSCPRGSFPSDRCPSGCAKYYALLQYFQCVDP